MIFTKGDHQSAKFQTFTCSGEILPNLYFEFQLKKYGGVISHVQKSDAKFEEKTICCFKNDKNLMNFDPNAQKISKCAL